MSLTINGTTNTLTAASGLTIAGNTAITGTLSASGNVTFAGATTGILNVNATGTNATRLSLLNDGGQYFFGVDNSTGAGFGGTAYAQVIYAPAGRVVETSIAGTGVITKVSSTGLAVTGSATVGTGAASTFGNLILNGAAQANRGSYITFQRNSATVGYIGQRASVIGIGSNAEDMAYSAGTGLGHYWYVNGSAASSMSLDTTGLAVTGIVTPEADNTRTLGTGALRWSVVYAGTGTINTSDAREKTAVESITADEINAAKQLAKEIGTYRWLSAVEQKGDAARKHIGMTVQRAIAIMEANNLDPFAYGFICYDEWGDKFIEHPAVEAKDAVFDDDGNVVEPAVEGKDVWTEQVQFAGDRYSFRMDELLLFIATGFEARLSALEAA